MHCAEVLADVPNTQDYSHRFIHNYDRHLWEQVLDELPHRNVARLSIVISFLEQLPFSPKPIAELEVGIFERMFKDLTFEPPKGEKAVCVFFQQSEGKTLLPLIGCRPGTRTSNYTSGSPLDELRPLHGKLLLIEGAKGNCRDPYLLAVSGSPNFTSARFLSRPPDGNSETALLIPLPVKQNAYSKTRSLLGLDQLFGKVTDWTTLKHVAPPPRPPQAPDIFRIPTRPSAFPIANWNSFGKGALRERSQREY